MMPPTATPRLLLVRNDKLGDFILAWPALALLKHYQPHAHITMLLPPYTAPLAALCPWIDAVMLDRQQSVGELQQELRRQPFDGVITLFSTQRVAWAVWRAAIPYRLAPATKLWQWLYNHRLTQRRSRSQQPEYRYNCDLILRYLHDSGMTVPPRGDSVKSGDSLPPELTRPLLRPPPEEAHLVELPASTAGLRRVVIHPGSGGSASCLPPPRYAELLNRLAAEWPLEVVITAGVGEEPLAHAVAALVVGAPVTAA